MALFSSLVTFFLVVTLIQGDDPCTNYQTIHQLQRSVSHVSQNNDHLICDRLLTQGWYRFDTGEMPTSCVQVYHCGTHIPLWLQGSFPTKDEGIVTRRICGDMSHDDNDCCDYYKDIQVKNCGGFLAYELFPVPGCSMGFCAGSGQPCPKGNWSASGFEPCVDGHPHLTDNPRLSKPIVINRGDFKFECHIPYDPAKRDALFDVQWLFDGKPDALIPVVQVPATVRIAQLNGDMLAGHMGTSVSCSVRIYFSSNMTGIKSDFRNSNSYLVGLKVDHEMLTLHEVDKEATVKLISTIPVVCRNRSHCEVGVLLSSNCEKLMVDKCELAIKPSDWNSERGQAEVPIKMTLQEDNMVKNNHDCFIKLTPLPNGVGNEWTGVTIPAVKLHTVDNVKPGLCTATGDPHITTFDDTRAYHLYKTGEFIMFRNRRRTVEIHIRTWKCNAVACICGVAVRDENDIIVVEMCHGEQGKTFPRTYLRNLAAFSNFTTVNVDKTGRNFLINLPSGGSVKVSADPKSIFMNTFVEVPGSEKGHTEGLCGSFDDNKDNDITAKGGRVYHFEQQPLEFEESWRIQRGESLFDKDPPVVPNTLVKYCQCHDNTKSCSLPQVDVAVQLAKCPDCQNIVPGLMTEPLSLAFTTTLPTSTFPDSATLQPMTTPAHMTVLTTFQPDPTAVPKPFNYGQINETVVLRNFPTPSRLNETYVTNYCKHRLLNSTTVKMCVATLNIDIKPAIDMCVEDIKITDDLSFANSALQDVLETCSHEKLTRPDSYIKKNGTIIPAPESKQCSGACSGQGDCIDGECQCNYYFEGEDCSIDKRQPPSIKEIVGGHICDSEKRECTNPTIIGENILNSNESTCKLHKFVTEGFFQTFKEETVPMGFISSNNVKCKIPTDEVREKPVTVYEISISNHGQEYSREQLFIIYNGKCIQCDEMGHCKQKLNTCLISDKCYTSGELDAITHKGICNPPTNPTGWTQLGGGFSHLPPSPTPTVDTPNIAPLGGQILPRPDVWTRNSTGCTCSFNNGRTDCACCEDGACQCPEGSQNMCSKCDDMDSCGEEKPSPEYGIDGWTAKFTGCFCLFELNRSDCACCQNFGCPCGHAHKNQCVECGHMNRCGTKPEIFGPAYQNH